MHSWSLWEKMVLFACLLVFCLLRVNGNVKDGKEKKADDWDNEMKKYQKTLEADPILNVWSIGLLATGTLLVVCGLIVIVVAALLEHERNEQLQLTPMVSFLHPSPLSNYLAVFRDTRMQVSGYFTTILHANPIWKSVLVRPHLKSTHRIWLISPSIRVLDCWSAEPVWSWTPNSGTSPSSTFNLPQ